MMLVVQNGRHVSLIPASIQHCSKLLSPRPALSKVEAGVDVVVVVAAVVVVVDDDDDNDGLFKPTQ